MTINLENPRTDAEAVIRVALRAGGLITSMRNQGLRNIRRKSSAIDIVTEADVAAENLIREELAALDSKLGFWGEESNRRPDEVAFWVVDPIDGTNNFAMGLPLYAVNIALQNGPDTLLGVTVELPAQRVYWAAAGEGAYLRTPDGQEQRLQVSVATSLEHMFLTTGFPYHRAEHMDNNCAEHQYFLTSAQGIRSLGASAIDFAFVATGALGGYWEGWLKPWDAAPGVLLVREAGGKVTNYHGDKWDLQDQTVIASNGHPQVHQALVDGVRTARANLAERLI